MVHLPTLEAQERNFKTHKKQIYNSGYRFAVISPNEIKYYNNKKSLYKDFPVFSPKSKPTFGTFSMLIDIGKETKSLEYRKERLEAEEKANKKNLEQVLKKMNELKKERKFLSRK